jgi:NAD(P)H-dependent FMN reductase
MKILTFAASNSANSLNRQLIDYAGRLIEEGLIADAEVTTLDLADYDMPTFSVDRQEADGIPQAAHDFFSAVGDADAVIVSFAEHNGNYTSAYKNLFDWTSRIDMRVYQDTPAVLFATSPGPGGGANVLQMAVASGQFFGYEVLASLSIPAFYDNVNPADGTITNPEIDSEFRAAVTALATESMREAA